MISVLITFFFAFCTRLSYNYLTDPENIVYKVIIVPHTLLQIDETDILQRLNKILSGTSVLQLTNFGRLAPITQSLRETFPILESVRIVSFLNNRLVVQIQYREPSIIIRNT